jgi:PAS domain S-box-containing protein
MNAAMPRPVAAQEDNDAQPASERTFRAMLNILEDIQWERARTQEANLAVLNILEDFQKEKGDLKEASRAVVNILEDFDAERGVLTVTNRAVINILEDLEQERSKTERLNAQLEERVRARTRELQLSEERFRLLVEGVRDYAIFMLDPAGHVVTWNSGAARIKGYQTEEILGRHFACFYLPEEVAAGHPGRELARAAASGLFEEEGWRVRKDGSRFMAHVVIRPVYDDAGRHLGYSKVTRDITERNLAKAQELEALRREMLLKEIHHRVKNNLQVISSLLYLQSNSISDHGTMQRLQESQSRVKSIALIHEKLYRSTDLENLDFAEYVCDLVSELQRTYQTYHQSVTVQTEIAEVRLGIDTAVPCGLIINELVSNALKHGFPPGRGGQVAVTLRPAAERTYLLTVRDNGVGFPRGFDWRQSKSLGLNLVCDLTKQLEGHVEVHSDGGTAFEIRFAELQYKDRR